MPNRTIYLPDDLDEVSRRLKLNLSRVVQQAIRDLDVAASPDETSAEIDAATRRATALGLDWSDHSLEETRAAAQER